MDHTNPPWRSLDAPADTPASGGKTSRDGPAAPATSSTADWSTSGRILSTIAVASACAIAAFVLALNSGSPADIIVDGAVDEPPATAPFAPRASGTSPLELVVEIVGAVARPGVYRLEAGARIGDLVAAAGGYGGRVDTDRAERELNLAAPLDDGQQIRVPARGDLPAPSQAGSGPSGADGLVNLNLATGAQLDALPGIGPATIEKILASREEAPFATVDDLRTRGLVGQKTFDGIRETLTVD